MSDEVRRIVPFETTRSSDDGLTLEGYAAVFDSPTLIESWEGRFAERVKRGAFAKTIQERTPVLQFDHGQHPLIGSMPLGSISTLREDDRGLFVRARISDNWLMEPVRDAIRDGAINGMSFRFRVIRDEDDRDAEWARPFGDGVSGRTLLEVAMPELGPVVFPAYDATSVGVRSEDDNLLAVRMVERIETKAQQHTEDSGTGDDAAPKGTSEPAAERSTVAPPATHATPPENTESTEEVRTMAHMTVEERAARQDELQSQLRTLADEYDGAVMPDEVREEWDTLNTEHDEHERAIRETEDRRAKIAALAGDEKREDKPRDGFGKPVNVIRNRPDNIWDMTEARKQARDIDDLPGIYTDRAHRAIEQARYDGTDVDGKRAEAERLLVNKDTKDAQLARRMLHTGSPLYHRAFGKVVESLSTNVLTREEQRALEVGTDGEGGFAVPFDLDPTVILANDGALNPLRTVARVEQTVSKTWQGLTSTGITVSRSAEEAQASDDSPAFLQPTVTPERVLGFVPFSVELDQDWGSLRTELTRLLADAKNIEEATSFTTGTGTTPNPQGVVTGIIAASNDVDVATTGSLAAADVYALEEAVGPRYRARASFLGSKGSYNDIRQLDSSGGGDLWVRLAGAQPNELLGYPAYELSTLQAAAGDGTASMVFGDFQTGFLIVDRVGMSVELIPHLFGANGRPTGQRGIQAMWRNSSKVIVADALTALTDDGS